MSGMKPLHPVFAFYVANRPNYNALVALGHFFALNGVSE
jgi:hypothetical protein